MFFWRREKKTQNSARMNDLRVNFYRKKTQKNSKKWGKKLNQLCMKQGGYHQILIERGTNFYWEIRKTQFVYFFNPRSGKNQNTIYIFFLIREAEK